MFKVEVKKSKDLVISLEERGSYGEVDIFATDRTGKSVVILSLKNGMYKRITYANMEGLVTDSSGRIMETYE